MWVKYYAGDPLAVVGLVSLDQVTKIRPAATSVAGVIVWNVYATYSGGISELRLNPDSLATEDEAFAKINDILVNGT